MVSELEPDDNTFVLSRHKHLSGFWANDIQAQLTKRNIDTIVLAGMYANLCVKSHLRDAVENGYKVLVVTDATGALSEKMLEAAQTNYEPKVIFLRARSEEGARSRPRTARPACRPLRPVRARLLRRGRQRGAHPISPSVRTPPLSTRSVRVASGSRIPSRPSWHGQQRGVPQTPRPRRGLFRR